MSWKDNAKQQQTKMGAGKRYKLHAGENVIRVLPTKQHKGDEEPSVFAPRLVHSNVGPQKRWVTCGKGPDGKGKCYTCDKKIPRLESSDSKSARKMAVDAKPIEQLVLQVATYNADSEKFSGPFPLELKGGGADSISFRVLKTLQNPKKDCVDPKKGHNISIEATGENLSRRYSSPVIEDDVTAVPLVIVKAMKTFDELIPKYSEQAHLDAWSSKPRDDDDDYDGGGFSGDDGDEDEDERPRSKKRRVEEDEEEEEPAPKKKRKPVDEDEDEPEEDEEEQADEEDEESEEEDEEEPAPKKKRKPAADEDEEEDEEEEEPTPKKKRRAPVEEEDEEEDEPEDEDEEPAPKKKRKPVVEEDEEEEEPEEDEEEEEPAPKKKRKPVDEDEGEEEDEPEDEEESDPDDESEADEEEEEEDEEPAPKKKPVKKPVAKKPAPKKKVRR